MSLTSSANSPTRSPRSSHSSRSSPSSPASPASPPSPSSRSPHATYRAPCAAPVRKTYPALQESMETCTLANGLRLCYLPKPGFSKTFAILAANYGSIDQSFTCDGTRLDTPAGVAHFLEHKMFEDKDGNALQKFAQTGANPNAFTSQTMTAYHFSCTERFEENLRVLLQFVFTPYFTVENIGKERGIIAQEIRMLDDTPSWQAYNGLFQGLFHEHPVRVPIGGSIDSIAELTPALLYSCYHAFYNPQNMALVVCGETDFPTLCDIATRFSPCETRAGAGQESPMPETRHYGQRRDTVAAPLVTREMQVSQPQMLLGFKDQPLRAGESRLRRKIVGALAVQILCGSTSPLFVELYEKHQITRYFDGDYNVIPEGAIAVFGGESREPAAVQAAIRQEVVRLARDGIEAARFSRMKKTLYALYLRLLDRPEEYARQQIDALFGGEHYLDFAELFDTIRATDVQEMYTRWAQPDRMTLSVILPKGAGSILPEPSAQMQPGTPSGTSPGTPKEGQSA